MEVEVSAIQYPDYGNQNDVATDPSHLFYTLLLYMLILVIHSIEMNSLTFEITKMFKILCIQIQISRTYNIKYQKHAISTPTTHN